MRVLAASHEPLHPPSGGGSAEAIYLLQDLLERGHEVTFIAPRCRAKPPDLGPRFTLREFTRLDIHRHCSWRIPKYLLYPLFLKRMLREELRRQPADVLLAQHLVSAVAVARAGRETGTPFVLNYLDCLTGYFEAWPFWIGSGLWARWLVNWELSAPRRWQADGVLAVSDNLAEAIVRRGMPPERVLPIYYGYDEAIFFPAAEAPQGTATSPPVVIMQGSFDYHHLGEIAKQAILTVHAERPGAIFRFLGPVSPALASLRQAVNRIAPQVQMDCPGFVPYQEIGALLRRATVGMIPYAASSGSHYALLAKAVEFAASGLPFAAISMEGTKRFFANCPAARFTEFDGKELGQALLSWLRETPQARYAAGKQAAATMRERASWRVLAGKVSGFLEAVGKVDRPRKQG